MRIIELSKDFYSLEEFKKYVGSFNAENTNISIPQKNEILISYHKNDNSLNISILRDQASLLPGKTYTISCDFVLKEKVKSALPHDVPKIAMDGVVDSKNIFDVFSSLSVPNEIGIWHKTLTVTVPKNFSKAWFRLHLGIKKNAGEILIKNLIVTESSFEIRLCENLFYKKGNIYTLKKITNENIYELYTEFSKLISLKKFKPIQEIIEYLYPTPTSKTFRHIQKIIKKFTLEHDILYKKINIYSYIVSGKVSKLTCHIKELINIFNNYDEILILDALKFLERKSSWENLSKLITFTDKLEFLNRNVEYLYLKAQLYRRLKNKNLETINYENALTLDINKPNLNWKLFFDEINPGLSYRRDELKFITNNLDKIQHIANSYKPINISFSNSPVFVFWDQGYNNAPYLVQIMIDRMRKIYKDRLVLLTGANLDFYVDTPSGIQKFRNTSRAFFSDFIRTALLMQYGGTWIDSTAFTTDRFDQEVTEALNAEKCNFYALRIPNNPFRISNWFLATNQINNRIILLMYAALLLYTEQYDDTFEYYQYHSFFEILTQLDHQALCDFDYRPINDYQPKAHELLKTFRSDWDDARFYKFIDQCPIQKLTYRSNTDHLRTQSVYKTLLRNGLKL